MLFPAIKPYNTFYHKVDKLHTLHVEECGNNNGLPVIFLHGGPGAGCEKDHRRFFNPEHYRIILFDQRGCGKSTPHAELENNNTQLLIQDIESIRKHLNINKWVIFGGSWGSTLAIAYSEKHPSKVMKLILRGIFLCRKKDIDWFYQDGASNIFPDYWDEFTSVIPKEERNNMLKAYYKKLTSNDELMKMKAAKAWSTWEGKASCLQHNAKVVDQFSNSHVALSLARIECHYFINNCFMEPNQLLKNVKLLKDINGIIVHGRYDVVCPIDQAFALHDAWPDSRLDIIAEAGHSAHEPGITKALVDATEETYFQLS
ncbi:MAG: prolyl aminopeptidase [Pseudomonadota bacterium]